jgi:hypothetical protein
VTDCIDTPLNPPELATGNPVLDRPPPQPEPQELPPADHPVLDLGENEAPIFQV